MEIRLNLGIIEFVRIENIPEKWAFLDYFPLFRSILQIGYLGTKKAFLILFFLLLCVKMMKLLNNKVEGLISGEIKIFKVAQDSFVFGPGQFFV